MKFETKPYIYSYQSFNKYLNDWVLYKKETSKFSLHKLTIDLELNSITEISSILKGRRKVSHRLLEKIKGYLSLSDQEKFYLELIAELDRSEKSNEFIFNILKEKASIERSLQKDIL